MNEIPLPGAIFKMPDGRVFTWMTSKAYTRKDGTDTELSIWRTSCATCGASFEVATPKAGYTKAFARKHCDVHKLTKDEVTQRWGKAMNDAKKAKRGRHD